jgi:hypothetical protein
MKGVFNVKFEKYNIKKDEYVTSSPRNKISSIKVPDRSDSNDD